MSRPPAVRSIYPLALPWLVLFAAALPVGGTAFAVPRGVLAVGFVLIGLFVLLVVGNFVSYIRKAARGERW